MYYKGCWKDAHGKTCDCYACDCGCGIEIPLMELARGDVIALCKCGKWYNFPGSGSQFDEPMELSAEAGRRYCENVA